MPVTLAAIAKQVGVSKATVSRALRNDRLIHPETRSLILEAAARAGYERPTRKRRQPEVSCTRILLVFPSGAQTHYALPAYLKGVTRACTDAGCQLVVEELRPGSESSNPLPRGHQLGKVDAAIIAERHYPEHLQVIAEMANRIPAVSIQWERSPTKLDMVSAYNAQGIQTLVQHLYENGHRKIGWVGAQYDASFFADRQAGFFRGCIDCNLKIDFAHLYRNSQNISTPARLLQIVKAGITALVCSCDWEAIQIGRAALLAGLRIPEDLSLTGFDAGPELLANGKLLTSYDPNFTELGRLAVKAVLQRFKDPGAPHMTYMQEGRIHAGETVTKLTASSA